MPTLSRLCSAIVRLAPRRRLLSLSLVSPLVLLPSLLTAQQTAQPVASELAQIAGVSVGSLHLFGYADNVQVGWTGFQYARNSFGHIHSVQVDYLAEVIPLIVLRQPAHYDANARPLTKEQQTVYGSDIVPAGARLLFRPASRLEPYLTGAGGVAYFSQRLFSPGATKLNFSAEFGAGLQCELNPRIGIRFGYSVFHLSNGDTGHHNPAFDTNLLYAAVTYHLHPKSTR